MADLPPGFTWKDEKQSGLPEGFTWKDDQKPRMQQRFDPEEYAGFEEGMAPKFFSEAKGAQREFDLPDAFRLGGKDASVGDALQAARARMLGNVEDLTKAYQAQGWEVSADKYGNPIVTNPNTGERGYVNRPETAKEGLDPLDVGAAVGQAAFYAAGGGPAQLLKNAASRALGTMASLTATDVVAQKAAGREEIDPWQTAVVAGLGTVSELAAPVLVAVWNKAKGSAVAKGKAVAKALGREVDDDQARQLSAFYDDLKGGASDDALEAQARGYQVTRGERTRDFDQLSIEERIRKSPGEGGKLLREARAMNEANLARQIDDVQGQMGTGAAGTAEDAAQIAANELQATQRAMKDVTRSNYGKAGNSTVNVDQLPKLAQRVKRTEAAQEGLFSPENYPRTAAAVKVIDAMPERATMGIGPGAEVSGVRLKTIEGTRRSLNRLYRAAEPEDARLVKKIIDEFDNWEDSIPDTAIRGTKGDLEAIKAGRAAHRLEREAFTPKNANDTGGKVAEKIASGELDARQVAAQLYSDSAQPKAGAANVVKKMGQVLGKDSDGFKAMKELTWLRLTQSRRGEPLGSEAVVSNIREMVQGKNKQFAQELFTPAELSELGRISI